jgi:hypothetical protein
MTKTMIHTGLAMTLAAVAGTTTPAAAQFEESPDAILQWYEQEWVTMERKVPDFFLAGYGAVWLPPISKTFDPASPGYDPFDRYDLGAPDSETVYGTESEWAAARDELQRAAGLVYVDIVMNHNSGRQTSGNFQQAGGWPHFWMGPVDLPFKSPTDNWGDFHGGVPGGYLQSENPGGPRYNTTDGDLVALVDIDQSTNNLFIRQPTGPGASNIPAGTIYNQPDPANAQYYGDLALPGEFVSNPGTFRNPGTFNYTFAPFNEADPMAGDPVVENATEYLMRWTRWMLEVQKVDGFRLDAAKHIPSWFWDNLWDAAVHNRWERPDGQLATPFSFGESTAGNFFVFDNYVRKVTGQNRPGDSWGNRDTLDLAGSGGLRNMINAGGFGDWNTAVFDAGGGHIDNVDDGFNNGSLGVNHAFSHDNGTLGDGSSRPGLPSERQMGYYVHAYLLLRTGETIVYHNARNTLRSFGFFPREGVSTALGWDPITNQPDSVITNLLEIRNEYARGFWIPLNGNFSDLMVSERRTPGNGKTNLLVGANDRYDAGFDTVTVTTGYPQGTRLVELTGNAANPDVDPGNQIAETLIVGPGGNVTIRVPRNSSSTGEHNRGFVVYGEALPDAELLLPGVTGTIPSQLVGSPSPNPGSARLAELRVVTGDTLQLRVEASQGDALDPDSIDTGAAFRINAGFEDWNNNGSPDYAWGDVFQGFEDFTFVSDPTSGGGSGLYVQPIDTTQLEEGTNYITVRVRKQRDRCRPSRPSCGACRRSGGRSRPRCRTS